MKPTQEYLRAVANNDQPKSKRTTFEERKAVGDAHEQRVADEFRRRGWTVAPCGIGKFPPQIIDALSITSSPRRWEPDLIAVRGVEIVYIDAKGSMDSGHRDRRFVSSDCVMKQISLHALGYLPIYYVFANLEVSSPYEMYSRGKFEEHSPVGSGGAYYSISAAHCRSFDALFGKPHARPALRSVA